jgi:Ca-activated chloride channel family protein
MLSGTLSGTSSKRATPVALGLLLAGTALGVLPIGQFATATTTGPSPRPRPLQPTPGFSPDGSAKAGPLTLQATLSQSKLAVGQDGTVFVDVKLTGAAAEESLATRRPIDFALVLDVSGSMQDDNKIGLLRQACEGITSRLSGNDRVALVSFSTEANTLFNLQTLDGSKAKATFLDAIKGLVARGGTNISSGLEGGAAELARSVRPGASRRIILLTDGQANQGIADDVGLRGVTARLYAQGISVTTVGLGLDYNALLLSSMAEVGGGTYHYVDNPQRIAGIYDAELRSMRSLVARGVRVNLAPIEGVELVNVVEWLADRSNGGATVTVGDFEAGRSTKIVAQLRVPTGRNVTGADVLHVSFTGEDARTSAALASSPVALGIEFTTRDDEAQASVQASCACEIKDARASGYLETARLRSEAGDKQGARAALVQLGAIQKDVSYKAADGVVQNMSVHDLEQKLCDDTGEGGARARMFSRSAASAQAK